MQVLARAVRESDSGGVRGKDLEIGDIAIQTPLVVGDDMRWQG